MTIIEREEIQIVSKRTDKVLNILKVKNAEIVSKYRKIENVKNIISVKKL